MSTEKELPPYTDNQDHEYLDIDDHLPRYEESQQAARKSIKTKDFLSTIENRGKPWALLTLTANEPLSKNIATYIEGSPVKGTVKLSLDRPEYIYSVYISIKGDYLNGSTAGYAYPGENFTFLDITHTLWSPTYGRPLNVTQADTKYNSSTPLPSGNDNPTLFNGPLSGEFSWPFSVNLPKTVVTPLHFGHREMGTFQLPQTFNQPGIRATVVYTVTLTLKRHGILSVDDTLTTTFGYIPIIRPPPFSPLRQLAYQEGTPLLSPTSDPDGWHSLPPLELKAIVFKSHEAHVKCTLSLGKPLSYSRGTVVPLFLCLESEDEQALELLASPKAIMARVRRRIKDHVHAGNHFEYSGWRDALDHSQRAVWWPSGPKGDSGRLRSLQGEIHLKPGMRPTTALGPFRIEYSIVLFNFEAAGVDFPDSQVLQEQPIEIATAFAPGPRPKPHTPAVYEPDTKLAPQSQEFSIGFY